MNLYLMRHAEAERVGGDVFSDEARPLTDHGRFQAKAIAEELKRRNVLPLIITSPFRRTVQTGDILCDILEAGPLHEDPLLASQGRAPDLVALLRAYPTAPNLLLLGHQPDLGFLTTQLLGFEFGFGTATVAAFESRPSSAWHFLWTVSPETL